MHIRCLHMPLISCFILTPWVNWRTVADLDLTSILIRNNEIRWLQSGPVGLRMVRPQRFFTHASMHLWEGLVNCCRMAGYFRRTALICIWVGRLVACFLVGIWDGSGNATLSGNKLAGLYSSVSEKLGTLSLLLVFLTFHFYQLYIKYTHFQICYYAYYAKSLQEGAK